MALGALAPLAVVLPAVDPELGDAAVVRTELRAAPVGHQSVARGTGEREARARVVRVRRGHVLRVVAAVAGLLDRRVGHRRVALGALDQRGAVYSREGERRGLRWADGVLPYMLTRFSRNLGDLMPVLAQLDRFSLAQQRVITIPLLKQMMSQDTTETLT